METAKKRKECVSRSLTARNLLQKRAGRTVRLHNDILKQLIGPAEAKGVWLIYGSEKNGKTWFSLTLAKDLAMGEKVAYVSAEEGTDESFRMAVGRAGITAADKVLFDEYLSVEEIIEKFKRPNTPRMIFLDNLTIYNDEFKNVKIRDFINSLPSKLIVCVAHEERKEPFPAAARMVKKLAKVYVHVVGLRAQVVSRFSKGGAVDIDLDKCEMYWGTDEE
jgi:hypothetical protein